MHVRSSMGATGDLGHNGLGAVGGMGSWKAWAVWTTIAARPRRLDDNTRCIASISPLLSLIARCEQFLEKPVLPPSQFFLALSALARPTCRCPFPAWCLLVSLFGPRVGPVPCPLNFFSLPGQDSKPGLWTEDVPSHFPTFFHYWLLLAGVVTDVWVLLKLVHDPPPALRSDGTRGVLGSGASGGWHPPWYRLDGSNGPVLVAVVSSMCELSTLSLLLDQCRRTVGKSICPGDLNGSQSALVTSTSPPCMPPPARSLAGAVRALHRVGLKPCMLHSVALLR